MNGREGGREEGGKREKERERGRQRKERQRCEKTMLLRRRGDGERRGKKMKYQWCSSQCPRHTCYSLEGGHSPGEPQL